MNGCPGEGVCSLRFVSRDRNDLLVASWVTSRPPKGREGGRQGRKRDCGMWDERWPYVRSTEYDYYCSSIRRRWVK